MCMEHANTPLSPSLRLQEWFIRANASQVALSPEKAREVWEGAHYAEMERNDP